MARNSAINLEKREAQLKRDLKEIAVKKLAAAEIIKRDLPAAKAQVYKHLATLAALGVAEDYAAVLLYIAYICGQGGVLLPLLRKILLDQVSLDDARKEQGTGTYYAVEDGKTIVRTGLGYLEEKSVGNSVTIFITEAGKAAFKAAEAAVTPVVEDAEQAGEEAAGAQS